MTIERRRLFEAVCWICPEVLVRSTPAGQWTQKSEEDLWKELVICILGSQVSFEKAHQAAEALWLSGFADPRSAVLRRQIRIAGVLRLAGHRFPKIRARQICETIKKIYESGSSLRSLLETTSTALEARMGLVRQASGIGPKQASLFLRNIGFTVDLAIIDSHVLRYMKLMGIDRQIDAGSPIARYETNESILRRHATDAGYAVGHMDWAIWVVMRSVPREMRSWM